MAFFPAAFPAANRAPKERLTVIREYGPARQSRCRIAAPMAVQLAVWPSAIDPHQEHSVPAPCTASCIGACSAGGHEYYRDYYRARRCEYCFNKGAAIAFAISLSNFFASLWIMLTRCAWNGQGLEITSPDRRYAVQGGGAVQRAAGLGDCHGGVMKVRRAIIIPAILALGVAGSILPGLAMSATAGPAASVHVHVVAAPASLNVYYHG